MISYFLQNKTLEINSQLVNSFSSQNKLPNSIRELIAEAGKPELEFFEDLTYLAWILTRTWQGENLTNEFNLKFLETIKADIITLCFELMLESFRKLKKFTFPSSAFSGLRNLIMISLTKFYNDKRVDIPLDLINICHTYKCNNSGKNKSLVDAFQDHKIFKSKEFWEACLVYSMRKSTESFDFHDEKFSIQFETVADNYTKLLTGSFLEVAYNMVKFKMKKESIKEVTEKYAELYCLPKENKITISDFIENEYKN